MEETLPHFARYIHSSQFANALSIVFIFLFILGGTGVSSPLGITYFLEVDTSDLDGALERTRWTFFRVCGVNAHGISSNCGPVKLAPLSAWDVGTDNFPSSLQGGAESGPIRADIYGVWVTAWLLVWVWLVLTMVKLADSLKYNEYSAMHVRVGRIIRYTPPALALPIFVMYLYTFISVQAGFSGDNRDATFGAAALGFIIGAMVAIYICELILYQLRVQFRPYYNDLPQ